MLSRVSWALAQISCWLRYVLRPNFRSANWLSESQVKKWSHQMAQYDSNPPSKTRQWCGSRGAETAASKCYVTVPICYERPSVDALRLFIMQVPMMDIAGRRPLLLFPMLAMILDLAVMTVCLVLQVPINRSTYLIVQLHPDYRQLYSMLYNKLNCTHYT